MLKKGILILIISFLPHIIIAKPIAIKEFFRSPDTLGYKLNPTGTYLVGELVEKDKIILELVDTQSFERYQIIDFITSTSAYLEDYIWIDDDTLYITYQENKHGKKNAIVNVSVKNGKSNVKLRKIQHEGLLIDALPSDDDRILYAKWEDNQFDQLKVYYASTEEVITGDMKYAKEFNNTLDHAFVYISDNKGQIRLGAKLNEQEIELWYLKRNGEWKYFYKFNEIDYKFVPVGFFDDERIAVLSNKDTDTISLFEFNIEQKSFGKLLYQHNRFDLINAEISSDGKDIRSVQYFDHSQLVTVSLKKSDGVDSKKLKKLFPKKQFNIVSESKDKNKKVIFAFSSEEPGGYFLYDSINNSKRLLSNRYKGLSNKKFTVSKTFTIKNRSSEEIEIILTQPKQSNGVLLVMPHGGPIGVRDYAIYNPETQFFASRGYSILKVNFHGSQGYGKAFLSKGVGQFGKLIEEDISTAVEYVLNNHHYQSICAVGSSYGGFSSMMLAIKKPDIYDCVVAMYGIYDLPLLFNTSNVRLQKEYIQSITKVVGEYDHGLKQVSPFRLADKISIPVLLIAGADDEVAVYEQTNRMKYRLKQLGKKVEFLSYSKVGHGHNTWSGEMHQMAFINDFLTRTLKMKPKLDQSNKLILGEEKTLIADGYFFKDSVENDESLAYEYYKKAAELGYPRAMFNYGDYFHTGEMVDKDYNVAIQWYKSASKAGYSNASFRLGEIYRNNKIIKEDLKKSLTYFQLADQQNHLEAKYEVAKAYCLGKGIERDIKRCIKLLEQIYTKKNNKKVHQKQLEILNILKHVVWSDTLKPTELSQLKKFITMHLNISQHNDFELDIISYGKYKRHRFDWKHLSSNQPLKIKRGNSNSIGAIYKIKSSIQSGSEKMRSMVKFRWYHPELTNPKTSESFSHTDGLYFANHGEEIQSLFVFRKDWQLVPGLWTFEAYSLDNKLLFKKSFDIIRK